MESGKESGMVKLTENQLLSFEDQGYLVCRDILDIEEDLVPIRKEYEVLLENIAEKLFSDGQISSRFETLAFDQRICAMYREMGSKLHSYFDISLPQKDVGHETPVHTGPAVFNLIKNSKVLNILESILGSEIYSNPTQHVRIKPPAKFADNGDEITPEVTTTVWHQDLATITPEADHSEIVTVWIPFTEANEKNGCLLLAPGSHKRGLAVHCHDHSSRYSRQAIPEKFVGNSKVAVRMSPGDILLLDKMTMHASLPNLSESIRWSFDLRYQKIGWPTGRPWFPGFIVRSQEHPSKTLIDATEWTLLWKEARRNMVSNAPSAFQRWSAENPDCA